MSEELIIKKYPNRRLYNTETSSYITLEDVRNLVRLHQKFKVLDARSNEDMTNYVLLQIISEEEAGKFPLFTTDLLQNIIRYYDSPLQKAVTEYLEKGFALFNHQQPMPNMSLSEITENIKNNFTTWQSSMSEMMDNFHNYTPNKPKKKKKVK